MKRRYYFLFAALLILIAVVRVICTYRWTAQGFDEPVHVTAGMELLDRHTYTFDPVHPPLARLAIGVPLYLAGERYPHLSAEDSAKPSSVVGNRILYDNGHYLRNLTLARSAMLPFLITASLLVFLWARREFGDFAAVTSVMLFTTTPMVLAFSGLAYTDMVAATTQFGALFAFANWLREPNKRSTFLLAGATGLALMSKLTSLLFLPVAGLGILACWWLVARIESSADQHQFHWRQLVAATAIAACVLWGGYGFSVGHLREQMGISPQAMPSFQHFPGPLAKLARTMVIKDPPVPAPALLSGLAVGWVLNKTAPPAYLLGHIKNGGWWYFFLVGLVVKTPLPLLILGGIGLFSLRDCLRQKRWSALAPAAAVIAILFVTMPVKYNAGVRHVLVCSRCLQLLLVVGVHVCGLPEANASLGCGWR